MDSWLFEEVLVKIMKNGGESMGERGDMFMGSWV